MNGIITEKDYPVQGLWVFKSIIRSLPGLIILILFLAFSVGARTDNTSFYIYLFIYIGIGMAFGLILPFLRRLTFHYSIEDKFLTLNQGILSRQQRHIPYGVIQNLFVKQDLFDRILGLASLTIENASQGAGALAAPQEQRVFGMRIGNQRRQQIEMVGFSGNKVSVPGLTKQNAETLKEIVLQKMKENPIEDSQSGL